LNPLYLILVDVLDYDCHLQRGVLLPLDSVLLLLLYHEPRVKLLPLEFGVHLPQLVLDDLLVANDLPDNADFSLVFIDSIDLRDGAEDVEHEEVSDMHYVYLKGKINEGYLFVHAVRRREKIGNY